MALLRAGRRGLRDARPLHRRRAGAARNGANATCSRASTATPSAACAARSSRSSRATSCASCSTGSACRRPRASAGPEALAGVLAQLEGFEAPAAAWESELLPARVADYSISWLDDLCTAGRIAWTRLRGAAPDAGNGAHRAGARDADRAAAAPATGAVDAAHRGPARGRAGAVVARANASPTTCASTAPRSSTNWSPARTCCAPNWRTRWPNWSRAAACTATASPACARCWCRSRSGRRRSAAGAGARRCSASRTPGAGR